MAKQGMLVAPQPEAVEAGADVMRAGGNAVDGAIACALVQGVVDPMMCGIAGFGSLGIYHARAGLPRLPRLPCAGARAARPDMWADLIEGEARDGYGFILKGHVNDVGYQSICLPATLARLSGRSASTAACPGRRWWRRPSPGPSSGWSVRPHVYGFWSDPGQMGRVTQSAPPDRHAGRPRALLPRRRQPEADRRRVVNRDYAADAAPDRPRRRRRLLSRRDRRAHRRRHARQRRPAGARRPDRLPAGDATSRSGATTAALRVATNQPPGGGPMLLEMLNVLEHFDLAGAGAQHDRIPARGLRGDEARHGRQGPPCRRPGLRRRARSSA
jgi:gamma-glutamyltranspeptidase/glutathione hydrolase